MVIAIILSLFLFAGTMPFNQSVKSVCYVESPSVWYLTNSGAGEIISGWERNLLDPGVKSVLFHFERPDIIEFELTRGLVDGDIIAKGDTVAVLVSREGIGRREVSEASLTMGVAEHDALLQGAREEDIEVAAAEVKKFEIELETSRLGMIRAEALYDSGFATFDEYMEAEGLNKLMAAELELAQTKLKAFRAGARPADIEVAGRNIEMLDRFYRSGERVMGRNEAIISPINGRLKLGNNLEAWVLIERLDTVAVYIQVPESSVSSLETGQPVEISILADIQPFRTGALTGIEYFQGAITAPGAYAVVLLENQDGSLSPGMTGKAKLSIGKQTLLDGIKLSF